MRTDPCFQRRRDSGVFFDKVLYSALCNSSALKTQKKRIFMSRNRFCFFSLLLIIRQRFSDFRREIQNHLISAFSGYDKCVVFQINIPDIHPDTFADPNTGAKKQRYNRIIAFRSDPLEFLLMFCQLVTGLRLFQDADHFFLVQTDDRFLMNFGQGNKFRYI